MTLRDNLKGFGARDGAAVVDFEDGRTLCFVPQWRGDSVRRIVRVALFDGDACVACVFGGCFWTAGSVTQTELGQLCDFAIELERDVYRHYCQGRIEEDAWQVRFRTFWKIVIKTRQIAEALGKGQLPVLCEKPEGA